MSVALNVFLRKAVDESAIPFPVSMTKKSGFGANLSSGDITNAFASAVRNEISEKQEKGFPVARYDAVKGQVYLEMTDGTRDYVKG